MNSMASKYITLQLKVGDHFSGTECTKIKSTTSSQIDLWCRSKMAVINTQMKQTRKCTD